MVVPQFVEQLLPTPENRSLNPVISNFLYTVNRIVNTTINKTDTGSWVCSDYILIFREWKRLIDRLTEKNTARWIDG